MSEGMTFWSRRGFLRGGAAMLAAVPSAAAWAGAPSVSLRPKPRPQEFHKRLISGPEQLINASGLRGRVAYTVAHVESGLVLESRDSAVGLPPASVMKAITALYALEALGADYRFQTRLLATGPVAGGELRGDLVLMGGGDPTLDTDAMAALAGKLKAAGVSRVTGRFLVYGGALPYQRVIDSGQPDHVGYNPSISGLALNYNRVHFEWRRTGSSYGVAMDARSKNYRPAVAMSRVAIVNREAPLFTYKDAGGRDEWTVARAALGKGGSRWLPVRKPEAYAGEVFAALAKSKGVSLPAPKVVEAAPRGTVIASVASAALREILRDMLKYSNNLTAEMCGMAATVAREGRAASIAASAAAMQRWAQQSMGMGRAKLVDHSGLGAASNVQAGDLARALALAHKSTGLPQMLKPIAMRHDNGKVNRDHPVKVHAKTGTLNFVSALAGYLTAPDGTELAFVIFTADEEARARIARKDRERPQGGAAWNKRSKRLQQKLIERWGTIYGT